MEDATSEKPDMFPETDWSLVLRASGRKEGAADKALESLCARYWRPLYVFVRSQGRSKQDAEDIVQGFFAKLLRNENLKSTDAERGRLRSFLLVALRRYMVTDLRKRNAQKRGAGQAAIPMDLAAAEAYLPADTGLDPERQFERSWAITVLETVHDAVGAEYEAKGQAEVFETLGGFITPDGDDVPYATLADTLGIAVGTVHVRVFRLRKRYRERLREEVASGLENPSEVDAELAFLRDALRA